MALRELNIELDFGGTSTADALDEINKYVDDVRDNFGELLTTAELVSDEGAKAMYDFGAAIGANIGSGSPMNTELALLAEKFGKNEKQITKLIEKARQDIRLDEELKAAAKAAGLTDKEFQQLNKNIDKNAQGARGLDGIYKTIAGIGLVSMLSGFATASHQAYTELEKQRVMLQNLSGKAYPEVNQAINDTLKSSQGLASEGGLKTAVNDALQMGASVKFITGNLSGLQQAAAVTGSDLSQVMQSAQQAILTGSDEFLQKNASVFGKYREQFKAIGSGADQASIQMRESLISDALKNNTELTQQYARHINTAAGRAEIFSQRMGDLRESVGELIDRGLAPFQAIILPVLNYFTDAEKGLARVTVAALALSPIIGTIIVAALYDMAVAGWAAISPWLPFIAIAAAVGAAIALVGLAINDLLTWMDGGDSIIGDFLGPFKDFDLKKTFQGAIDGIIGLAKKYGKFIVMALFPFSILYYYWDELTQFFSGIPERIVDMFSGITNQLKVLLKGILPDWAVKLLVKSGIDMGPDEERVNDAIITKDGKVIHTHPNDNLIATKSSPFGNFSPAKQSGGIVLSLNFGDVVLGGASESDARSFVEKVKNVIEEEVVPILEKLTGTPSPEAA